MDAKRPLLIFHVLSIIFTSSIDAQSPQTESIGIQDYTLLPGHLQPLGSKQTQKPIEVANEFPSPGDFFANYVDKSKPLLIKGAAKLSPAFKLWTDEYLQSHPEANTTQVFVEPGKKENRTKGGFHISLKEFIQQYHQKNVYMVNGVPDHLQKDVLVPSPLRCKDSKKYLVDTVLWFSSGGTKSVLHNDDVDNINCLFRGRKQLMFIEYPKYIKQVLIDRPVGGYSDVDVDRVDFTKYKGLAEVEFINATMEEGDCLFIPFKWFHQVNSYNNDNQQNVAVNVWFTHIRGHRPKKCNIKPEEATLDKYVFQDLERQKKEAQEELQGQTKDGDAEQEGGAESGAEGGENNEGDTPLWTTFEGYLRGGKVKDMDFNDFFDKFNTYQVEQYPQGTLEEAGNDYENAVKELFDILDDNKDEVMDMSDYDEIEKKSEEVEARLDNQIARIEDILEDASESLQKKGTPSKSTKKDEL